MEQDINCKKEKELFFSYLGSLGLGALLLGVTTVNGNYCTVGVI